MMIQNKTKNTVIAREYKSAQTFFEKAFGLLLNSNPRAMIFETRFGIHTFFMKVPIDIAVLDRTNKIAVIKRRLEPNRIFVWNPRFGKILELPNGTLDTSKTEVGDTISFLPQKQKK